MISKSRLKKMSKRKISKEVLDFLDKSVEEGLKKIIEEAGIEAEISGRKVIKLNDIKKQLSKRREKYNVIFLTCKSGDLFILMQPAGLSPRFLIRLMSTWMMIFWSIFMTAGKK